MAPEVADSFARFNAKWSNESWVMSDVFGGLSKPSRAPVGM